MVRLYINLTKWIIVLQALSIVQTLNIYNNACCQALINNSLFTQTSSCIGRLQVE